MSLTDKNVEQVVALLIAYLQRFDEVTNLANHLRSAPIWRSNDGTLQVGALTDADKQQLRDRILKDLDDGDVIATTIRGLIAD